MSNDDMVKYKLRWTKQYWPYIGARFQSRTEFENDDTTTILRINTLTLNNHKN